MWMTGKLIEENKIAQLACMINHCKNYVLPSFFKIFMRTNLCSALVIQENSYSIANINLETIDTVQKILQVQTTATTTTNT